jgi:hypothetical protein
VEVTEGVDPFSTVRLVLGALAELGREPGPGVDAGAWLIAVAILASRIRRAAVEIYAEHIGDVRAAEMSPDVVGLVGGSLRTVFAAEVER